MPNDEGVVLFDGHDTSQFVSGIGDGFPSDAWQVKDGALCVVPRMHWKNLYTRKQYTDFELTWEWKLPAGGNSGVKYQCVQGRIDPDLAEVFAGTAITVGFTLVLAAVAVVLLLRRPKWLEGLWPRRAVSLVAILGAVWALSVGLGLMRERQVARLHPPGFEYQMIDDRTQHGDRLHMTGALYDLLAAPDAGPKPVGEWNESRILVVGPHVEHWLNGRRVLVYDLGSQPLREAVGRSKFRKIEGFAAKSAGYLQLQHHGTEAWFRNIRVRENPTLPPPAGPDTAR